MTTLWPKKLPKNKNTHDPGNRLHALFIIAAFTGIHYLTQTNFQPQASPDVVTNFSDGAWLKTKITSYDDTGTVIDGEGYENSLISSGTYDGKPCWVYSNNFTFIYTNGTQRDDFLTYYIEKSTYSNLHLSSKRVTDGKVICDEEIFRENEDLMMTY